jgi:hypothetical protein
LQTLVPEPGTPWQGPGSAYHGRPRQLHGTRLACGDAEDQAPWWLLPALPPEARTACGDGGRTWMAQGCKSTPRAGWPWQRPPMPTPARAARWWRAGAGAPLGVLSVGGEADAAIPARTVPAVTALVPTLPRTPRAPRLWLGSVCRRGWPLLLVALLDQAPRPRGRFLPAPWPALPVPEEAPPSLPARSMPQAA